MTSNSPSFDTYLMHHGVKGMKWGVRKKRESNFVNPLKYRKKKIAKLMAKKESVERKKVANKAQAELSKTKEYKAYQKGLKSGFKTNKDTKFFKNKKGKVNGVYIKEIADYADKKKEITNKYIDEFAAATLKDIGYKNTSAGRKWLKKKGLTF